jgi:arylformamidase
MKTKHPWPLLAFAALLLVGVWLRDPQPAVAQATTRHDAAVMRDLAYGPHARQRYDLYLPAKPTGAPTIFFIHGGAWKHGDKSNLGSIRNKARRWTAAGAFVVSTNYRLVPEVNPVEQARDIGRALAAAQAQVAALGGNADDFVLMGHSAGAHLVALLASSPNLMRESGATPWRGSVLLDAGAIDVVQIMRLPHLPLFDAAFGADPAVWEVASPMQRLSSKTAPILAVCSAERRISCAHNERFLDKAKSFGTRTQLLPMPLNHMQINRELGEDNAYTRDVEAFMRGIGISLTP